MFNIFIFTYKGLNKNAVFDKIKSISSWYRFDESSFIICTNKSIDELNNEIKIFIDLEKDKYLFLKIKLEHYKGLLPSDIWDWLNKQIDKARNKI